MAGDEFNRDGSAALTCLGEQRKVRASVLVLQGNRRPKQSPGADSRRDRAPEIARSVLRSLAESANAMSLTIPRRVTIRGHIEEASALNNQLFAFVLHWRRFILEG